MTSWSRGTNGEHAGGAQGLVERVEGFRATRVRFSTPSGEGTCMGDQGKLLYSTDIKYGIKKGVLHRGPGISTE